MNRNKTLHAIVYITKYALTKGVVTIKNAQITADKYVRANDPYHYLWAGPNDWHTTPEAAAARVKEMAQAKLKSLAKQVAKVNKILASGVPTSEWSKKERLFGKVAAGSSTKEPGEE